VRIASAQTVRIHVRSLRGEARSSEGQSTDVHLEKIAAWQGLPPADHGAADGPIIVLSAARCAHTTFLRHVILIMIPIERTAKATR